jgi:hypothetical protein
MFSAAAPGGPGMRTSPCPCSPWPGWRPARPRPKKGIGTSDSLRESLRIVLDADYTPPSPLRDVAANRSVDDLAPENPLAAEMAQMRETLEEVRKNVTPRTCIPPSTREDISVLRSFIEENIKALDPWNIDKLSEGKVSDGQRKWAQELIAKPRPTKAPKAENEDPWASDGPGGCSDEPPF